MLIVSSTWGDKKSFQLIPVEESCPYVDVIFDPSTGILGVVNKQHKPKMQLVARMDDNGDPIPRKGRVVAGQDKHQVQRLMFDAFYEYTLDNADDIRTFVELHARNPQHPAFRQFFADHGGKFEGLVPKFQSDVREVVAASSDPEVDQALLIDMPAPHPEAMTRNELKLAA